MAETFYTMTEVCERTGLSYQTLKFYCNQGLVPHVKRDSRNRRIFDEKCLAWVKDLSCLKRCGLSIAEMKEYLALCLDGEPTIPERKKMLEAKASALEEEIRIARASLDYIAKKQQFYDAVLSGEIPFQSNLIR